MDHNRESGFTLIELLVVVAIIGLLAAIAIPQFSEYRARAYDARAESDLRNLVSAEEAYFTDNESYASCANATCEAPGLPGFERSNGVVITAVSVGGGTGFTATSRHPDGTRVYSYSSLTGHTTSADAGGGAAVG